MAQPVENYMPMGDYLRAVERVRAAVTPAQFEYLLYELAIDLKRSVLHVIIEETATALRT